ncbi:hypothetical protein CsatB_021608 [Cannabis sativa]
MGSSGGKGKVVLRVFVGAIFLLVTFWFLLVGIISNHHHVHVHVHAIKTVSIGSVTSSSSTDEMLKHWKWNGRGSSLRWDSNLIYVSKRRVPNGPDPIHNRRVVTTRQPPGRA